MGMFRRQPAATHFANSGKVGKTPFKGEMFRFISPLKIPLFTDQSRPRKLQITRLARKGKTRSFRYSSSPNGNRLCWISIGLPFRHPYWMYPPGTGDEGQGEKRNHVGRGRFSWRLTVPTPFVPLGHFPLTGGIGLGRRRGRARRVVAPHANDHCYLSCRAPEGRRVKDAAPCRFASFDTRRTTGKLPVEARLSG